MNKRGSVELMLLGLIAVIAIVGLVMLFKGMTGRAAGGAMTRQVLVNEEEFRIERPGGYQCECQGRCVYDGRIEQATTSITQKQPDAAANCQKTLAGRCAPQPLVDFSITCDNR
jgi:hypothetical protein